MQINQTSVPWNKKRSRKKPADHFYVSSTWKSIRAGFIASVPHINLPPINGIRYQNKYCADCWEMGKLNDQRIEVDHIKEISDGGSQSDYKNLRSRCHAHHNSKTHAEREKRNLK